MTHDIQTMMWKELREYFVRAGNGRRGILAIIVVLLVFSVLIPYQAGVSWYTSPIAVPLYGFYLPLSLVTNVIADSFAGERERHTLETLLASRLSDQAILLGKITSCVVYSFGISLAGALVGAVVVNLTHPSTSVHFYTLPVFAAMIATGIILTVLFTCIGILISLRAQSVRQVQQTLGIVFMVIFFVPFLVFQLLPAQARLNVSHEIASLAQSGQLSSVGLGVVAALLVVDVILFGIVRASFRRSHLILQ